MELTQIIIKPYLTEKTYTVRSLHEQEVIAFIVNPKASKHEIKFAFETIYGIKPEKINTITRKPAMIRTGTQQPGMTKLAKIAYVTLPKGVKLAVTKEEIEEAKDELKEVEKTTKKASKAETKQVEAGEEEKVKKTTKKTSTKAKAAKNAEAAEK